MSGGTFDYNQYRIRDISNRIEQEIYNSGREKTPRELKEEKMYHYDPTYTPDPNHYEYPDEIIQEFKNAYEALRKAEIYAQRIDWLLAGDDGEESFIKRLKEELDALKVELKNKTFEIEDEED